VAGFRVIVGTGAALMLAACQIHQQKPQAPMDEQMAHMQA
jgi:hypothetical protein